MLTLRDPVERAVSQWRFWRRAADYRKSFAEFVEEEWGQAVTFGRYAEHLERYLEHWDRDDLVVFVFERMVVDPEATRRRLGGELELDLDLFPAEAGTERANRSFVPRFPKLNAAAHRFGQWLRERDLHWPINAAKSLGAKKVLRWGSEAVARLELEADVAVRERLQSELEGDVHRLVDLLDEHPSDWGPGLLAEVQSEFGRQRD